MSIQLAKATEDYAMLNHLENEQKIPLGLQEFIAIGAIGPSALRGHRKGTIPTVRKCLSRIRLAGIPETADAYAAWLDRRTVHLLNAIDHKTNLRPWGSARKALNLFLRDCFYNHYLRREYGLRRIERWLEIPLDSVVGKALRKDKDGSHLPRWPGLKKLKREQSVQYQDHARQMAQRKGLSARVHLDMFLWLKNR